MGGGAIESVCNCPGDDVMAEGGCVCAAAYVIGGGGQGLI